MFRLSTCLVMSVFVISCARGPIKNPEQAMRKSSSFPELKDDLEFSTLVDGLDADIKQLRTKGEGDLSFGPRKIPRPTYAKALEFLLAKAREDKTGESFRKALRENFEPFEIFGRDHWGEVFMTSYYEPVIEGSRKPTSRFRQGLYGIPRDMVDVDFGSFASTRPSLMSFKTLVLEQRSQSSVLRGRLLPAKDGTAARIVAYPDRAELMSSGLLKVQSTAVAWVDPIDAFLLEIQGSGIVHLEDGTEQSVGYAGQNGHSYVSIGKFLFNVIPKEKMSIQAIETHLRSISPEEAQKIMNLNPSFVFFKSLPRVGITYFGTELVAGRSVATDQTFFPKGALAYLEFDRPVFNSAKDIEPSAWQHTSRFVLDQDTGGAIRGADRLDLFWGRGDSAKQSAGVMKNKGRLNYFVPTLQFERALIQRTDLSTSITAPAGAK